MKTKLFTLLLFLSAVLSAQDGLHFAPFAAIGFQAFETTMAPGVGGYYEAGAYVYQEKEEKTSTLLHGKGYYTGYYGRIRENGRETWLSNRFLGAEGGIGLQYDNRLFFSGNLGYLYLQDSKVRSRDSKLTQGTFYVSADMKGVLYRWGELAAVAGLTLRIPFRDVAHWNQSGRLMASGVAGLLYEF